MSHRWPRLYLVSPKVGRECRGFRALEWGGGPRPRFFNLPECSWSASIFFRLATLIPKLSSDPALVPGNPEKSRTSRSEISRIFRFAKIRHANDFVICDSLPGKFAEMSRIPTVLRAFFFRKMAGRGLPLLTLSESIAPQPGTFSAH